jgi:hypothetical protein
MDAGSRLAPKKSRILTLWAAACWLYGCACNGFAGTLARCAIVPFAARPAAGPESGLITQRGRARNGESVTRVQTDAAGGASAAIGTRRKLSL